jgi:hypothetical protein
MNWPGLKHQHAVERWGGSVDWDDETRIPNGVAVKSLNSRFRAESPGTRYGRRHTMTYPSSGGVTGLDVLNVLIDNPQQIPILFTDTGLLLRESPPGTKTLVPVNPPLVLPTNAYMQDTLAFNRIYMAMSDGQTGLIPPIVLDGPSGITSIAGQNPTGALWAQNTLYQVGDLVRAPDGRWWRCTSAASSLTSATPPQWPLLNGYFAEANPIASIAYAGGFAPTALVTLGGTIVGIIAGNSITISGNSNPLFNSTFIVANITGPTTLNIEFALASSESGVGGEIGATSWVPAVATDPVSGSQWEEWTPACTQYLPAPDVVGATIADSPGAGTIAAGKDVYIKLTYVIPETGETPRSSPVVFVNTAANDRLTLSFNGQPPGATIGPCMPRWIAEINLQPGFFFPFTMNVWFAAVATGSAAPADSAYAAYALQQPVSIPVILTSLGSVAPGGESVVGVALSSGNGFFATVPTITFLGGGGSGARAVANCKPVFSHAGGGTVAYQLLGITILSGGSGYLTPPTVVFSPAGPITGTALLSGTIPGGGFYVQGCAPALLYPSADQAFIGEGGTRYMCVLRQNLNGSLSPVDQGSPIPVNLIGEYQTNIISIVRDGSGNVTATVSDITGFTLNQDVSLQGCVGDATFNGFWQLTNVQQTLAPNGILQWSDPGHPSASNDATGVVTAPAGPPPVAFLPPGGPNTGQNIAAFTVAAPQDGQPIQLQLGPYTYLPSSSPTVGFVGSILSMRGPLILTFVAANLSRSTGGQVTATLADIAGITVGAFLTVADAGDASFDGFYLIEGVASTTGTAGIVTWQQVDTTSATTTGNLSIQNGVSGQAQATLQGASGLAAGDVVNIQGGGAAFDGPVTLASVLGNTVSFPSPATGIATLTNATMTLLQDLPTTSSAVTAAITSILRDYAGNVTAQVPSLSGWAAGQIVTVAGVGDSTFNGLFELTSAVLNNDGITASLAWVQASQSTSSASFGGTISSIPDMLINFDDNFLAEGEDVTSQLTAIPPPDSADVYFSETLNRVIYTRGNDTQHFFSNIGDAENIDSDGGILSVAASNGAKTVCVREMENGEIISMKQNAGYAVIQNSLTPDQWEVVRRWKGRGPVSARAVDVGPDFMVIFVEYTGPYRYFQGQLTWIGQEKQGTWDRVNWAAKNTICVAVDDDNKTVHFALPLDGATTPNKDVSVNYFNGWQDPLILNMMGQVIPNRYGRRWDEADLSVKSMKVVQRSLNPAVDTRINDKALLFGRSDQGVSTVYVDMSIPDVYQDDGVPFFAISETAVPAPGSTLVQMTTIAGLSVGQSLIYDYGGANQETIVIAALIAAPPQVQAVFAETHLANIPVIGATAPPLGIDWQYQPAFDNSPTCDVLRIAKAKGQLLGDGSINFQAITNDPSVEVDPVSVIPDEPTVAKSFSIGLRLGEDSSNVGLNINNGKVPGVWAQLHKLIIGGNEEYPSEKTQ